MKNILLKVILSAVLLTAVTTWADSPHFIRGPVASFDTKTGDLCVSFKEAGLGNTPITYTLSVGSELFTCQCFTKSGNQPQGDPNGQSFSNDSVSTTITPHNGQITASLCLDPQKGSAGCQGGGLVLKLIDAEYDTIHFCDVTDNICVDFAHEGGSVDIVFPSGHGH
jgi:hypothetical protein